MVRIGPRLMTATFSGLLAAAGLTVVTAGPAAAVTGLGNVSATTVVDSSATKSAVALCPAGKRVTGGGARLTIVTGQVSITRLAPTTTGDGYEAQAFEDRDGFTGTWGLVVTAVCADPLAGYQIVTATSVPSSDTTESVIATCPAGTQVIGLGGAVAPGNGFVLLSNAVPTAAVAPTRVSALGSESRGGFAGTWTVQAWAICTAAPVAGHIAVSTSGASSSVSPKTTTSTCPAGRPVHGLGFQLGGSLPDLFLNAAYPNPQAPVGTSVPVTFSEGQAGLIGLWAIRTVAICAS